MPDIRLEGCRPEPLAHYLKAMGVLRLVAEQADPDARGYWKGDVFYLTSRLEQKDLADFFLRDYVPTPIVAPWNGSSGFYPKDNKVGIAGLQNSTAARFATYRDVIRLAQYGLTKMGSASKPAEEQKKRFLQWCRNHFPDAALAWLDAAYVLTEEKPWYPPLLGTGGNDGHLEFTNNFMMRLVEVFDMVTGQTKPPADVWLQGALFGEPVANLVDRAIGQFYPGAAGGANATAGFTGGSLVNPWDFILALEGALAFATASTRRLDVMSPGGMSYPFTVRQVGSGYGSAAMSDETSARAEMWLPLWRNPSTYKEVQALFSEGRARLGRRTAGNGLDFARAVASLGTDRGIEAFHRYGFQVRNGLAYFATPLGRWRVKYQPDINLLNQPQLDRWLRDLIQATANDKAPASLKRTTARLETSIMDACRHSGPVRMAEILIALGEVELALSKSIKFAEKAHLNPVPLLDPGWLKAADDGTTEFRLASAVASIGIRPYLAPVEVGGYASWLEGRLDHPRVVWGEGALPEKLFRVFQRRCLEWEREKTADSTAKALPLAGKIGLPLADIGAFLAGEVDETRLSELVVGLSLLDWNKVSYRELKASADVPFITAAYALLKLVHLPGPLEDVHVPFDAAVAQRAWSGDLVNAVRLAARRLKGSGFTPMVEVTSGNASLSRRIAASLIFPIGWGEVKVLMRQVIKPESKVAVAV